MELKAYTSNRIYWAVDERPADKEDALLVGEKFYLKSEADKVIAELKAQAEDDCAYWKTMSRKCADDNEVMAKQRAEALKRERHHKYKRCLAVARRCHNESLWWYSKGCGFEKYDKFWEKWEKRWLALADKFKDKEA